MYPFIRDGDVVTVSPLGKDPPRLGAVIAFVHPTMEKLVIHRVVRREADLYFMEGDNTTGVDGPITAANVLGLVTRVKRGRKGVFIGLGPERLLIAFLARREVVIPLVNGAARLLRPIRHIMRALSVPFQKADSS